MAELSRYLLLNLVTAVGYFGSGWLGMTLEIPPSHASPIWPASGVALAMAWTYGRQVLPGLLLGTLITQFYAFADFSQHADWMGSFMIGASITLGASLQALIGAGLLNRWVGRNDALIDDAKIIRFFVITLLSCAVSGSLGVTTLWTAGRISTFDIVDALVVWWAGDAIGAVIFTPLTLLFAGQPRLVWLSRQRLVFYPLLIAMVLVVVIFHYARRQDQTRINEQFAAQVELLNGSLQERLNAYLADNAALKALFDSSDHVSAEEFEQFAGSIRKDKGMILEWTPRIDDPMRADWEARNHVVIKQMKGPGVLEVADRRPEYFPITYVYPAEGNQNVLGYDVVSNPKVAEVVYPAIDAAEVRASQGIRLMQDDRMESGVVIYAPVYRKPMPDGDFEQRRRDFVGFAAIVFRVGREVDAILNWLGRHEVQLLVDIHDDRQILYSNNTAENGQVNPRYNALSASRTFLFAGRVWRLNYRPSPEFFNRQQSAASLWLLLSGFGLCGLTGIGLLMLTGRTARVEELVAARTEEIRRANAALNQEIAIRMQQENELRVAATTFESHEAIVVTDADGAILRVNQAFTHITGYSADEAIGRNPRFLASGYHDQAFYTQMYKSLAQEHRWQGEIWNRRKNGEVFPERLTLTSVRDSHGRVTHYVGIFSDVSEKKAAEQEIHNLAFYDPLTNLPNRRLLLDRLRHEIAAAKRQKCFGCLLFLDLDHFKNLNDSRGHHVGDELLIQVANRLRGIIREEDTACRLGGDEFIVMAPGRYDDLQQATTHAAMLAEKILLAINQPFIVGDGEHHFSTSIGVTLYPETAENPTDVIQQADTAMYRAKERGRNGICFYQPSMQAAADKRLTLEKEIRIALAESQFRLHYQPQVDSEGRVISAEALIRWMHPTKHLISPAEFIPVAEDTQLILPIGAWVLHEACRQIKAWDAQGKHLNHVAINVSSKQFRQSCFVQQVRQSLLDAGLSADRLVIELTEGSVIEDIDDTVAKMQALQSMGVRISIDDFGVGYSSLSYLKSLPLSQLKIDQSFVRHFDDNNAAVIVETIIAMAKSLGLNVIAEGVEAQNQVDFLKAKGCLFYQGYYFSRPLPADNFPFERPG